MMRGPRPSGVALSRRRTSLTRRGFTRWFRWMRTKPCRPNEAAADAHRSGRTHPMPTCGFFSWAAGLGRRAAESAHELRALRRDAGLGASCLGRNTKFVLLMSSQSSPLLWLKSQTACFVGTVGCRAKIRLHGSPSSRICTGPGSGGKAGMTVLPARRFPSVGMPTPQILAFRV